MDDPRIPRPETLTEPNFLTDVDADATNGVRAAISNAMVGLKKRYYGLGEDM